MLKKARSASDRPITIAAGRATINLFLGADCNSGVTAPERSHVPLQIPSRPSVHLCPSLRPLCGAEPVTVPSAGTFTRSDAEGRSSSTVPSAGES
jgi:hypothetical protein